MVTGAAEIGEQLNRRDQKRPEGKVQIQQLPQGETAMLKSHLMVDIWGTGTEWLFEELYVWFGEGQ